MYKHNETGKVISPTAYFNLPLKEKQYYHFIDDSSVVLASSSNVATSSSTMGYPVLVGGYQD